MDIKKILRNTLSFLLSALSALFPTLLYLFLVKRGVGDAMMYSAGSLVPVALISVIGACCVWLTLKKPLHKDSEPEEKEEETEETKEEEKKEDTSHREIAMEEYPELFLDKSPTENENTQAPLYYEVLMKAVNAQKAEYVPNENGETESEIDSILTLPEKEEERTPDIYDSLPDTLPEGYKVWEEETEEEEAENEEENEDPLPEKKHFFIGETVLSKVAVTFAAFLLSSVLAVILSFGFTVYTDDGVTVRSMGRRISYTWQDCGRYEISPSFFGDRLCITLYMLDGSEIELLPSGAMFSEEFSEKYGTVYVYALHASEEMTAAGAEKTVKERKTIESEFFPREDMGEYVQKLID